MLMVILHMPTIIQSYNNLQPAPITHVAVEYNDEV